MTENRLRLNVKLDNGIEGYVIRHKMAYIIVKIEERKVYKMRIGWTSPYWKEIDDLFKIKTREEQLYRKKNEYRDFGAYGNFAMKNTYQCKKAYI